MDSAKRRKAECLPEMQESLLGQEKSKRKKMPERLTIEEMQSIAESRGGDYLSKNYINSSTKLKWQCKEGHKWEATPNHIKRGSWCPYCVGKAKHTLDEMRMVAKSRGGECLSKRYINAKTKLMWRCKEGHEWEASPDSMKNSGHWCPYCAGNIRLTIDEMQRIAYSRGGKCLSRRYINIKTKLKWQCKEGHNWLAVPNTVKNHSSWCPYCAGQHKTTGDMKSLAKSRNGECLSKKYINVRTKLKWRCNEGHEWVAIPANVRNGQWCPICSRGVSERICREFFERIFNAKFPSHKPKWLPSPKGGRMELDGYCAELGLAFEYNGGQHYKPNGLFDKKISFEQRKEYDKTKRKLCEKHNIILIDVPYTIKYDRMQNYILKKCRKQGINIPKVIKIDYKSLNIYSPKRMEKMRRIAKEMDGICLSKKYINNRTKLIWQCNKGHRWEAIPSNIKRGHWCPYCANLAKLTIQEMQAIARNRGGECLSKRYVNALTRLMWRCKEDHKWQATPNAIKNHDTWCPVCARTARCRSR